MTNVEKDQEDISVVEEFAESASSSFPIKLLQTILQFLISPVKFFDLVLRHQFQNILKPIPFFLTAFTIATTAMVASSYFKIITWDVIFEKLNEQDSEELSVLLFSDEEMIDFSASTNLERDMEKVLRSKLNNYQKDIGADEIARYVRANGNETLALKIENEILKSPEEKFFFIGINIMLLVYLIPLWRLVHFFLKPKDKSPKETMALFCYFSGFLFLFFIGPIAYIINRVDWLALFAVSAVGYLIVQQLRVLRINYEVTFWRFMRAVFLANLCILPIVILFLTLVSLVKPS